MSNSLMMQSFLQSQSSAMSQRRQRIWDCLRQDTRTLQLCHFIGNLKKTMDYCLALEFPQAGEGYVKKGESFWTWKRSQVQTGVETKATERIVVHCSTAGRRRPLVYHHVKQNNKSPRSTRCNPYTHTYIYILKSAVLDFALGTQVDHCIFTDSSSAHQLVMKRGAGKGIRMDNHHGPRAGTTSRCVPSANRFNMADINATPAGGQRIRETRGIIAAIIMIIIIGLQH